MAKSEPVGGGAERETMKDAGTFLKRLAFEGGAIVSTAALSANEIVFYRKLKRMWVDDDGLGYVLLSEYWRKKGDAANKANIVHIADALMEVQPRWGSTKQRDDLLPCPFCGTKAISQGRLADNSTEQQWRIQCGNPFCTMKCQTQTCASYEDAVGFWQERKS